jgi:hypothetical protein
VDDHGILSTYIRPGRSVRLVDVSAGGALIETAHRLLPGGTVALQLEGAERRISINGRLLRCAIARVRPHAIAYRGAICFDDPLPWLVDDSPQGYGLPADETSEDCAAGVDATRPIICGQDVLVRSAEYAQKLRTRRNGT